MDISLTPETLEQHGRFVRGLSRALLADPGRAEDVAQEALARFVLPNDPRIRLWRSAAVMNTPVNPRRRDGVLRRWSIRLAILVLAPLMVLLAIELIWQLVGDPRPAIYERSLAKGAPHFQLARLGLLCGDDDPELAFTLTPGFRAEVAGNLYRINAHGMRGGPVTLDKPAGVRRVLVLGDSYAFGFGVAEADTIAAQLEAKLGSLYPGVQVLNMGVPGYQTGQQEVQLRRTGLRFAPDLVVLVYYANDNVTSPFLYDPRIKGPYLDELPLSYGMKRFLARSILYGRLAKAHSNHLTNIGELDMTGLRHCPTTSARLIRIARLLAEKKIAFVFAPIPALDNSRIFANKTHIYNLDHDRVLEFARSQGFVVADLRQALLQHRKPIEFLFVSREPLDSHLSREGYGILVASIFAQIREHELLR